MARRARGRAGRGPARPWRARRRRPRGAECTAKRSRSSRFARSTQYSNATPWGPPWVSCPGVTRCPNTDRVAPFVRCQSMKRSVPNGSRKVEELRGEGLLAKGLPVFVADEADVADRIRGIGGHQLQMHARVGRPNPHVQVSGLGVHDGSVAEDLEAALTLPLEVVQPARVPAVEAARHELARGLARRETARPAARVEVQRLARVPCPAVDLLGQPFRGLGEQVDERELARPVGVVDEVDAERARRSSADRRSPSRSTGGAGQVDLLRIPVRSRALRAPCGPASPRAAAPAARRPRAASLGAIGTGDPGAEGAGGAAIFGGGRPPNNT